jgi:hypothetical protein
MRYGNTVSRFLLAAIYGAALLFAAVGLAGVLAGLFKTLTTQPVVILVMAAGLPLGGAVIWLGLKIKSARAFLLLTTACWLLSRAAIVLLFPSFVLPGDELYFHQFVTRLVPAMAAGTIPTLSTIYDFPVWLSRAFPFYLPLAILFGPNDLWAARFLNVILGAAQLLILFFISRRLIGDRAARFTCLLLLIFPYHWINVLSYDPQIAGTFFLLIAVWMFLFLARRETYSAPILVCIGACLSLSLLLAGIQRGGIDLLLVGVMIVVVVVLLFFPPYRIHSRNIAVLALAVCALNPLRSEFNHWIKSNDANSLRSHTLGFMTRGWNLETLGEYLPLYEQLDAASPHAEKARTLEAILVTEFARQPIRSLIALPLIKTAKFFALGYASTAELGLSNAGYASATFVYQALRSLYAPIVLALCTLGTLLCWTRRRLQLRMLVPVLLIVMSCSAIVLLWETSPRYSHPVQFAVLMLSTLGVMRSRQVLAAMRQTKLLIEVTGAAAALVAGWLLVSACIFAFARAATAYQFADMRSVSVHLNGAPLVVQPLHSFSSSWEDAITIPAATSLPASVGVSFPEMTIAGRDHLTVSVWLPDSHPGKKIAYKVTCRTPEISQTVPSAESGHILRLMLPDRGNKTPTLELLLDSESGQTRIGFPVRVAFGYAVSN